MEPKKKKRTGIEREEKGCRLLKCYTLRLMLIEHRLEVKNDHEQRKKAEKGKNGTSLYTQNYRRPLMQTQQRNEKRTNVKQRENASDKDLTAARHHL